MSRPTDWSDVFGIDDPTPGDPFEVRRVASSWSALADDAEYAETKVRQLMTDDAIDGWLGEAGAAFRAQSTDLPDQLKKCKDSYRLASAALSWWAGQLTTHQADADSALAKGRTAKADLEAAQAHLATAQSSLDSAADAPALDAVPASAMTDLHPPSREQVQAAQQRLHAAQAAHAQASAAVSSAQSRLDAAKRLALDAGSLREQDGRTAAGRVHEAADAGIKPRHWWEKAKDWIADHWDVIIEVVRVAVAVLGVVALILGGPLAWVVFGLSVVLLADALNKWRQGKASGWDVLLCAIGCIPGARGLTSLGELSAAFRAGGLLGAGSHLLGAGKSAVVGLAQGIRALGPGLRTMAMSLRSGDLGALLQAFRGGRVYSMWDGVPHQTSFAPEQLTGTTALEHMAGALHDMGWTVDDLTRAINTPTSQLTATQWQNLRTLRDTVPMPDTGTVMQKVITPTQVDSYLLARPGGDFNPTMIGGSMTRATDTAHLTTPSDLYQGLRLDYPGTPYQDFGETVSMIRFRTDGPSFVVPRSSEMGGSARFDEWGAPFTGNGFTSAAGDVVPEFQHGSIVSMDDGAEMWEATTTGNQRLIAVLRDGQWMPEGAPVR